MKPHLATDEKDLLINLQNGDNIAFHRLYDTYSKAITAHLLYLLKSKELAEEVAQDTFMAVWEYRESIDVDQSFKAYLYKIATNKSYKVFRKAANDRVYRSYLLPVVEQGYNNIEAYITSKENQELLNSLLQQMPEKQREVFILSKLEGCSYNEISERLGITHSTINTHITRANQYIKAQILSRPEFMPIILASLMATTALA